MINDDSSAFGTNPFILIYFLRQECVSSEHETELRYDRLWNLYNIFIAMFLYFTKTR